MTENIERPHGWTTTQLGGEAFWFWCAGCATHHRYTVKLGKGEKGPCWSFSGSKESPSFQPSLLCNQNQADPARGVHRCHLYLTNGHVRYLSDCTHHLAGQTVPMEPAKW